MNVFNIIGIIGAVCTTFGFLPQIIKGYKTKHMDDVSKLMAIILLIGVICWLIYGFHKNDYIIIIANIIALILLIILLILKERYSRLA